MPKKTDNPKNPIFACIGASADGIKAMEEFFSNLEANDGLTFVVIQHLSPDHKSILGDILQRKTGLKVTDIEDNASPEPGHVYVLPAGFDATISGNRFHLKKYSKDQKGLHLPVDIFLRSLAADRKDTIAAILLSGAGSDGALGIREIKNAGGLVMVQDPESARFKSMPRNAIETGLVDRVASPRDLPALLLEFQRNCHKEIEPFTGDDTGERVTKLLQMVHSHTGHDFSGYKYTTIHRRIRRRMALHKKTNLGDYLRLLENEPGETDHLFKEFLISVTSFFRNKEAFYTLREKVLPEITDTETPDPVRIWVPACASGEEVYSIAILAKEYQASKRIRKDMQFFATDVDSKALEVARAGKYRENIRVDIPDDLLNKYFHKHGDIYQVHKEIRDMVTFAQHSAIKDPPYSRLDLVSCRNFLIYLEPDVQKNLLNTFHYALKTGGFLFLGNSETHSGRNDLYQTIDSKTRIYRKKENSKAIMEYLSQSRNRAPHLQQGGPHEGPAGKKMPVREFLETKGLREYMNPLLLIDKKGEIHYSLGKCDKYFRFHVGEPNQNIVSLAREGLKMPLSAALRKINGQKEPVKYKNIRVGGNGDDESVDLTLTPVEKPSHLSHLLIVSLEPTYAGRGKAVEKEPDDGSKARESDDYIIQMEQELQETRGYLNNVIEELETANEELRSANEEAQSTNEEMQSTNEELETSKEEMQSLNEELETSNNELHRKIEEVTHINNDLNNFLRSTDIGILFLDSNLKIRRFSPQIREIVNLQESDAGRPIQDFGINFLQEQLVEDVKKVLDRLKSVEKEISTQNDRQYWMRISPYRTIDDRIDGVVITFTDISGKNRLRKLEEEAERLRRYMYLFHHMQHGFALYRVIKNKKGVAGEIKLVEANIAYRELMQSAPGENKDKIFGDLFRQKDYRDNLLAKVLPGEEYREEIYFPEFDKHLKILFFTHEENFIAAFVQDITYEKKELKAHMHLASIVESTEDAIFSESPEGAILSWNNGAVRLYGYSEKEAVGSMSRNIFFDSHGKTESDMAEKAGKGEAVQGRESVHKRKDGTLIAVSVTKSPIRDDKGKVIALSNIVKDISWLKEREKELERAREETEKAGHLKTLFLENMSHEIRTPLNSILGFADMLRDEVTGDRPRKFVDNINNSGKQLLHLINDIVDISRLEAGELPVHLSNVNIVRLMEKTREEFEGFTTGNKEKIDFQIKLPGGADDLHIVTDKHRLQQILLNLLSNAFKYTDKGYVELGYEIIGKKEILFYVCDTGPGIDKKYQQVIFERFRQGEADGSGEKIIRGTGLGLAIARGLAERLGGRMWVESELQCGSKFCFTLPLKKGKPGNEAEVRANNGVIQAPRLEGKKVIIAEDDPYSLEMIKYMLRDTGITIYIAEDGKKALELFKNNPVDLILLDLRMPGKDGFEVAREIRQINPDIPVIAQSAYAMPEQIQKSEDKGFNEHLTKPLSREKLYDIMYKYLSL
jgi:two-component system, chemotaxis family, CheB/CheR fusion protein